MSTPKYLPDPNTPAVDPQTGALTPTFYRYLLDVNSQTGGGTGNNSDSFNYPSSAGGAGQILTSEGSGTASVWEDQLSALSQLDNDEGFINSTTLTATLADYQKKTDLDGYAKLDSPQFTGVPTAPTAPVNDATVQIANTGFVLSQAAVVAPLMDSTAAIGTSFRYARQDHVHQSDTSKANAHNPEITGLINLHSITGVISILPGTGSPNSVVSATKGSLFLRTDGASGNTLYVCQGTTTWTLIG